MAVDYLRLIQVFAQSTGSRQLFSAPAAEGPIMSLPLGDGEQKAHFVYDLSMSKRVLNETANFVQDHFLDRLLADCDPIRVRWVQLFVEQSPEFLDGPSHTRVRRVFKASIDRYAASVSGCPVEEIVDLIARGLETPGVTALAMAKSILRLRFAQILQAELKQQIVLDDALLFGPEIFTPSIRIKTSVYALNEVTDRFVQDYVTADQQLDSDFMLPLLSLFYMASTPILASCVAILNQARAAEGQCDGDEYINFKLAPTNYVAREAAKDVDLLGTPIRKGDKIYVMLFASTGCPFTAEQTLPFGHGKHLCPGADLSRLMVRQVLTAIAQIPPDQWRSLTPSTLQQGRGSAFLAFEDRR
jgi:cytochrome P450